MRPFALWGPDHLVVLGLAVLGGGVLVWRRRSLRAHPRPGARRLWAAALVVNEVSSWLWALGQGQARMPLQLCDLAVLLTAWALWGSRRRLVGELAYFWQAGGLQALLTPDLPYAFPHYWWIKFFLTHIGALWGVFYLALIGEIVPTGRSVWRVWCVSNGYLLLAGLLNVLWGTNYGYLAHKPNQPSLLDYFGPWPWYIAVLELAALGSFALYYLPFWLTKRREHAPGC